MKDLTLVIMAAGMGSRFGGLKQIEPVGPNGEFIVDYSIYDAIRAGFTKVVFIIKEENYDLFKETIGKRIEKQIEVEYTFQKQDAIPKEVEVPSSRVKPWGTSHAILAAKNNVSGPFAVINADDFYGRDAYMKAVEFFKNRRTDVLEYAIIGYKVENTLTEHGSVKRGVCEENDGYLTKLVECSVEKTNGTIIASPLSGAPSFEVASNTSISMNMFCFSTEMFNYIEDRMLEFFNKNKDNLDKCEYLIPETVYDNIIDNTAVVKVVPTTAVWQGITYKEDKELLVNEISRLIGNNEYPEKLWS